MKWSRKQLKIGFWSSIGFIIMAFLIIGYQRQIPIQFTNQNARSTYYSFLIMGVPMAVALASITHYHWRKIKGLLVIHTIGVIVLGTVLFFIVLVMDSFTSLWLDEQLLFKGRFNNQEVLQQHDGWSYKDRIVKVTPLISGLRYITPIDTMNLPESKWVKLKTTSNP